MNPEMIQKLKDVENMQYEATVNLGADPGDFVEATLVINRSDFALTTLKYALIGEDGTDPLQFSIDWSEQNTRRYWKGNQAPMALTYGSPRTSLWKEYKKPITLKENTTLFLKITNHYAAAGDIRKIQVIFEGFEKRRS